MSTKQKIYLYLGMFVIVSLLFVVWVIPHFWAEIQENSESLVSLKKELVSLRKEKENVKQLEAIYQTHQHDLNKMDRIFVDSELPIEFINFLEKNAEASQQKIEISLTPKKPKQEPWPSLLFQVSTLGSFPKFLEFLEKLENSPYLIEVLNLNVKKVTKAGTRGPEYRGDIEASLLLKVFVQ